jgi:hypothetical protein
MREKAINVQSGRTIDELYTFIWNNGKAEAMKNYNDDLVMAFAIGLWVRDTALKLRQQTIDMSRNMLGSINRSESQTAPIYSSKQAAAQQSWEMQTGLKDQKESLRWLL